MAIQFLNHSNGLEQEISYVHCSGFPKGQGWSAASFKELLALPYHYLCLAYDPEQGVQGFIVYSLLMDEAEIITFVVSPEYQKQGIGKILIKSLISILQTHQVKSIFLEVAKENSSAFFLYHKMGFVIKGERRNYYGQGKDALVMAYSIEGV